MLVLFKLLLIVAGEKIILEYLNKQLIKLYLLKLIWLSALWLLKR